MIAFWLIAALLLAVALLFAVSPLVRKRRSGDSVRAATVSIYREQLAELEADLLAGTLSREQYEESKRELVRRLLDEVANTPAERAPSAAGRASRVGTVVAVIVLMPVAAVLLYMHLGRPEAANTGPIATPAQEAAHSLTPEQIVIMVNRLAEKMKEHPGDANGWYQLARSYGALERFDDAAMAYAKAAALVPNDPQLLADYADALAVVNGGKLSGKPMEILQAALAIDPNAPKALAMAGSAAFNDRDYALAVQYWERLQKQLPVDSDIAKKVAASVAEARAAAGGNPSSLATSMARASRVAGTVSLSPAFAPKVAPTDTVFILARAVSGPTMPLAVQRVQVQDLPKAFTLDDSMAVAPAVRLSDFPEVVVEARVSKSGTALARSGDLSGSSAPVKVGSDNVRVVIERALP